MRRSRLLLLPLALSACPTNPPQPARPPQAEPTEPPTTPTLDADPDEVAAVAAAIEAAPGEVESTQLAALLREHWAWTLEARPLEATALGLHAYDHRVAAHGPDADEAQEARLRALLASAESLDPDGMSPADAQTLQLFRQQLAAAVATRACRFDRWSLSPRGNPVTEWNYLPEVHPFETPRDAARYLARVRAIPAAIEGDIANLELGAADGLYANAESTRRVLAMLDRQLEQPVAKWPLAAPMTQVAPERKPAGFDASLEALLVEQVVPALRAYRTVVAERILPHARSDDTPGLSSLPLGDACYAALVRKYTTLPRSASEVHEIGMKEIERINAEMRALGKKLFGTGDLEEILARLRTDEALFFDSEAEVEEAARQALAEAKAKMPNYFGRLPQADCVVTPIPDYEAPYTTIAYYRQPHADGSKPGEYFINLYEPETRPRYEARVLAVHESIPGHHLQIAIAQELEGLPAFRKHGGMTVFVEGWGLYTERLAEEMGLYRDDLDRMGMLSFDAWRASRLVVDTGLHAQGWSREQAKRFMLEHTALAPNNIDNEVDRYITTPGQALAYKTGQLELWRLRREAEEALADRFDLEGFHDAVLGGGAVTLEVLDQRVQAWIAASAAG